MAKKNNYSESPNICRVNEELLRGDTDETDRSWRIFRIMSEFVDGFELLQQYGLAATFFGSARTMPDNPLYQQAHDLSYKLSQEGFTIITGGGGGIMGAANQGAHDAGGPSVGLNIRLPMEQLPNRFTTAHKDFHYFFVRRVMLSFASEVYIFMPGGFGTLDEFFEIVTLVQTKKILPIPIILFGREYWGPLDTMFKEEFYQKYKYIDKDDTKLYHIVDSVDEAHKLIQQLVCEKV